MPVMWRTGHSLIKDKMKALQAPLAGEMSGHMFFTEGFYGHDDALYGAARLLRIVAAAGVPLAAMLADVPTFVSTPGDPSGLSGRPEIRCRRGRGHALQADARRD